MEKNAKLKKQRGVCFEEVISSIEQGGLLEEKLHYNQLKYPKQRLAIVKINDYAYLVPYLWDGEFVVFKTIIPSRKATKKLLKHEVRHESKALQKKELFTE